MVPAATHTNALNLSNARYCAALHLAHACRNHDDADATLVPTARRSDTAVGDDEIDEVSSEGSTDEEAEHEPAWPSREWAKHFQKRLGFTTAPGPSSIMAVFTSCCVGPGS